MIVDPVTRRYADALFELAREKEQLDAVRSDVKRLGAELAAPGAAEMLFDARVESERRRVSLDGVLAQLSPLTRNFVHLLFDKRRELVLKDLPRAFRQRDLVENDTVEGVVESPRPLAGEELSQLATALGARLGKTVTLENRVASGLVAGVRVIVQNKMIDYSAQGRLESLRRRMLDVALPSAAS